MSLIECKNINRFFGSGENRVHVLKDVSLSIEKGRLKGLAVFQTALVSVCLFFARKDYEFNRM